MLLAAPSNGLRSYAAAAATAQSDMKFLRFTGECSFALMSRGRESCIERGRDLTVYTKLMHFVDQACPFHSYSIRGAVPAPHSPIACLQSAENMIAFHFVKRCHWRTRFIVNSELLQFPGRGAQNCVRRQNNCSLD